jgi:UDP-2-acetamido-3-amino-2,3-dideoxy-glucuronate N-acetyltransferase
MNPSVNIAIVGCGYWGKNLVRNFAQSHTLRRVCDVNPAAAATQAALFPGVTSSTDFNELLADPTIQGIVLATPAGMHYEQAKAAILAGKDVFVEKPLALKYPEGRELVDLAESHHRILMVGHILEYHPAVVLLKRLVQSGELGRILYIYSNRLNLGKVRQVESILWSFAPHDISVICSLIGAAPVTVNASGGAYLQSGVEDVTITNLQFAGDVKAHIFVSWLHPFKEQKLVVVGDRKMAVFDDMAREGKLKIFDKGIEWSSSGTPVPRQTSETTLFFEETEPLRIECEHFLKCIRERQRPITDGESALRVLNVLEASQLSLERGAPVDLVKARQAAL